MIGKKSIANAVSEVASAENTQTTDTDTATPKENLSVPPAEESSSVPSAEKSAPEKIDTSGNTVLVSMVGDQQQNIEEVNRKFNNDLDRQIAGTLPKGYIHQLGTPGDILLSTGVPNLPIELSATRLEKKSKQEIHPFDIADLKNLPKELQRPIAVFSYGNPQKAQNIIIEIQSKGKNYLVELSLNYNRNGLDVNSIRGLFPKDLHEWLTWIQDGKTLYLNKERVQMHP